jgi:hypothetical protein
MPDDLPTAAATPSRSGQTSAEFKTPLEVRIAQRARQKLWRERHPERHAADTLVNYYRHREEIAQRRKAVRDPVANYARVKAWRAKQRAEKGPGWRRS